MLKPAVDENIPNTILGFTHTGPSGWSVTNNPNMPQGTTEWQGWSFTTKEFWMKADGQDRGSFNLGQGVIAVADPDEWDDYGKPTSKGTFDSTLSSPTIDVLGGQKFHLSFASHYKQEGNQKAEVTAVFDNGEQQQVLIYDKNSTSDNNGGHVLNKYEVREIQVPENAEKMTLQWRLYDAGNNWYWAVDNISLNEGAPQLPEKFDGNIEFVGAEHSVQGAEFLLNLHLRTNDMKMGVEKINTTIQYDASKFEFVSGPQGVTVDESIPGLLHVSVNGGKNFNETLEYDYQNTKIAELRFKAIAESGSGTFEIKDSEFYQFNQKYEVETLTEGSKTVTIHGKDKLDTNKDGLITISDLYGDDLTEELKQQIAENADSKPYKHVVVIGIDGGGQAIHKDAPYYENISSKKEKVGDRLNVPNIRDLVEGGAVSYTAQAVLPSSSSPNWGAMISGVGYDKHQIYNTESGKWYYHLDQYPTIFRKIREQMPQTKMAAFSNWKNITRGHIEPSLGVETSNGNDTHLADQIRQYILSDKMKDTSLVFIQFDELDGVGHGKGFYTKDYYNKLNTDIDQHVQTVVSAIDEAGIREETLILLTADHGGGTEQPDGSMTNPGSHGQDSEQAKTIYLGANGRTVATEETGEKILQGGNNKDVARTVLAGLDLADQEIGEGQLLDGMFAEQSELSNENAPILLLQRGNGGTFYNIVLEDEEKLSSTGQIAIELDIKTNGVDVKKVKPRKGVNILSVKENNGVLKIVATIDSSASTNKPLIKVMTDKHTEENKWEVSEAYIATSNEKDIMPNLK